MIRGALLLAGFGLAAVAALWAAGFSQDPHAIDLSNRLAAPGGAHPLGTDHLGRDLATRLVWGAAPSLSAVAIVLAGGLGLGILAGGIIALAPQPLRDSVQWLAKTALAVPTLVTALVLSAILGAGILTVSVALLVTSWAPYALTIAVLFDRIRGEVYWQASEALGATLSSAVRRHMLPNAWPALGGLAGADAGRAVILVASLGFIGLSADTGQPEWGAMIHEYRMFLFTEPRLVLAPILACTFVTVLLHGMLDRGRSYIPHNSWRRRFSFSGLFWEFGRSVFDDRANRDGRRWHFEPDDVVSEVRFGPLGRETASGALQGRFGGRSSGDEPARFGLSGGEPLHKQSEHGLVGARVREPDRDRSGVAGRHHADLERPQPKRLALGSGRIDGQSLARPGESYRQLWPSRSRSTGPPGPSFDGPTVTCAGGSDATVASDAQRNAADAGSWSGQHRSVRKAGG